LASTAAVSTDDSHASAGNVIDGGSVSIVDEAGRQDGSRIKRRWRVVLLRAKGEILGEVEAPDVATAKAAAAVQFDLDEIQRATGSWCRSLAEGSAERT
jgi:hypothetical protein